MQKDFDGWNKLQKFMDEQQPKNIFFKIREIWWCSLGINIGSEENGKNSLYERPVLIEKIFNGDMVRVIPLTSRLKDNAFHVIITFGAYKNSAALSHMRTISPKRLSRKIGRLDNDQFAVVKEKLKAL